MALFEVRDLEKHYPVTEGVLRREVGRVRAVDGISLDVEAGETVGVVGESGCGKSTAATAMLRLEEPTAGEVTFDGESVTDYSRAELKRFRRRAQMIFQDPTSSFDPRMSVGESVAEPLRIHGMRDRERRRRIVADLLERVGLSARDADRYPHELSGGMKQRVALARALSVDPDLLVADEPVSALDVSVQAEILALLSELQAEFGLAVVLISHDMGVVRQVCDRVNVMYLGEIVERGPTEAVFENPKHPYTEALMASIPRPDPRRRGEGVELTGDVPSPADPPPGCRFHTRCPRVVPPDGYDLDGSAWRGLMDLRGRLRRGALDVAELLERHDAETGPDGPARTDGTGASGTSGEDPVTAAVRAEFDLPERLSDPDAASILAEALSDLADGAIDSARERLAEAFPTVCEREHPELRSVGADRVAACHLHDEARSDEAPPGGRDGLS
ncbi:MAG: oligopeptide/dipeptide ABC transporter ATP-binding protein [Haloarculaceae archaeon]